MKHRATRYYIERDDRIRYPRMLDLQAEPTAGQHHRRTYRNHANYEQMRAQAEFHQACRERAAEARRAQQQAQYHASTVGFYDLGGIPFFVVIGLLLMWAISEILITIHS